MHRAHFAVGCGRMLSYGKEDVVASLRQDRNKGRKAAVQVLYAAELTGQTAKAIAHAGAAPEEVLLDDYALRLIAGVENHAQDIDKRLASVSENWPLSRMPVGDKCILRVAIFEMQYVDEVPLGVSINEAVELAKDFGGQDTSHRFVNGVLGSIAEQMTAEDEDEDEDAEGVVPVVTEEV